MKKKIISVSLAAAMSLSLFAFAACDKKGGGGGSDGWVDENAVTVAQVKEVPAVFVDSSATKYTDASIGTDTLVYTYEEGEAVTVAIEEGSDKVTLSEPETSTEGGVVTAEYTVTAKALGDYTLRFSKGGKEDGALSLTVRPAYPEDPEFDALIYQGGTNLWKTAHAHDPVVVEAGGKYYSFSTDNDGNFGYQVRESEDLIHWSVVGNAIPRCGSATSHSVYENGTAELQPVYDLLKEDGHWDESCWTLWAPDVTPAKDGGFWLYGCWTAAFGQGHSVIFQCYSDEITGPYEYVDMLVYSWDGWQNGAPNAIDPSIYYDAEGNMWMAYGSFNGGIWTLELDPETGLRKDGLTIEDISGSEYSRDERYGWPLIETNVMEGPVIQYREDVPVYTGDVTAFDASKMTYEDRYYMMGSHGSLFDSYNMRSYYSSEPNSGFVETPVVGVSGNRVSGSFTWKTSADDRSVNYDFYVPGHNDMFTTSDGVDILAYHNRSKYGNNEHYLFTSMFALNSKGIIVMNPNSYAGEALRKVTEAELLNLSGGDYLYRIVDSNDYTASDNGGYARSGLKLGANHAVTVNGAAAGEWYLYGDNYVYIELSGVKYYGVAMPAWLDACDKGGLAISCLSEDGGDCLYLDMTF